MRKAASIPAVQSGGIQDLATQGGALVIANDDDASLPDLDTARQDAAALSSPETHRLVPAIPPALSVAGTAFFAWRSTRTA